MKALMTSTSRRIALAITGLVFLLIGAVEDSDAFEIEVRPENGSYEDSNFGYSQGIWHVAYAETSEPYYTVEWYIDGVYQTSSYGNSENPKTTATFWPYWLPGSISGIDYTIKAVAYPIAGDPLGVVTASDSYTLKVYRPEFTTSTQLGVSGSVYLYKIDYSHPYISPSVEVYARNTGNEWGFARTIFHRFRHEVRGPGIQRMVEDDTPGGGQRLREDERYSATTPSDFSIYLGDGIQGEEYTSDVYLRLQVRGDVLQQNPNGGSRQVFKVGDWFVNESATFIRED